MKKITIMVSMFYILCSISLPVSAEKLGWYIGSSLGISDSDFDSGSFSQELLKSGITTTISTDNNPIGVKLFTGYRMSKNVAFEGGYVNLGERDFNVTAQGSNEQALSNAATPIAPLTYIEGLHISALLLHPVNDKIEIWAKVGFFGWKGEAEFKTTNLSTVTKHDGADNHYGLGVSYKINDKIDLIFEVENYEVENEDVLFYSVGIKYPLCPIICDIK